DSRAPGDPRRPGSPRPRSVEAGRRPSSGTRDLNRSDGLLRRTGRRAPIVSTSGLGTSLGARSMSPAAVISLGVGPSLGAGRREGRRGGGVVRWRRRRAGAGALWGAARPAGRSRRGPTPPGRAGGQPPTAELRGATAAVATPLGQAALTAPTGSRPPSRR